MSVDGDGQFAVVWSTYSENLMEAVKEPEDILTFRKKQPEKFKSICASQLSFVLETPFDILSDIENQKNTKGTPMKQLLSRTRRKLGDLQPLKLTSTLLNRLNYLMTVLENAGAHFVEGIFRKTGNLIQQRAVADALLLSDFNCTTFPWHEYSAHELAGALKSIISHLEQPLLTSGLIPFYLQAARLWDRNSLDVKDDESPDMAVMKRYTYSKQVNALRILILLLPQMHKSLLQRLFTLLHRVTSQVARNRMSPLALGTVFGPVLVPSVFSETFTVVDGFQNQNSDIQDAITLATRMIELNKELFLLPTRLINDIRDNDSSKTPTKHSKAREKRSESAWCSPYRRNHASRRSSSPINTSIRYAHIGYSTPQMFHDVSNTIAISASSVSTDKINTSDKSIEAKLAGYV